jgi:hypothetical protein
MPFRKIDYLEWARAHMGRVRFDLARSNVKDLTREELGLGPEQVPLSHPEDGDRALRELVAGRLGVPAASVMMTAGATQAIWLAMAALVEPGDRVLLETPSYEPLLRVCEERGAVVRRLERRAERGFQVELEELERSIDRGTRAVVLTNLHNPSGTAIAPERMQSIGQVARDHGATVVADEVYLDAALEGGLRPAASLGPNLVSIGSLTKAYGLGGIRIGWLAGPEELVRKARTAFDYVEALLPAPGEGIALVALRRAAELQERCRGIVRRNLGLVREWLSKRPDLSWTEPAGGTVCLVRLPVGVDAQELSRHLREAHSTLAVPGDVFGLRGHLRISTGMDEEVLRQGLRNVGKAIDQLKKRHG